MKRRPTSSTVRCTFVLPRELVDELKSVAPAELCANLDRLVILSLQEYIVRRRREQFEQNMAVMADDPEIRAECKAIAREFAIAEMDRLKK